MPDVKDASQRARYCANCGGGIVGEKSHPIIEAIADGLEVYLIGAGIFLFGAGIGIYNAYDKYAERQMKRERIKAGYVLHSGDINGSGSIDDKFYIIDGRPAVVELDGKPVVNNPQLDKVLTSE